MFRRRYDKLILWRRSMDLVAFIYHIVKVFPDSEKSGLSASMKKIVSGLPGKVLEANEALADADYQEAIKALEGAQKILVQLFNEALIARRVKVMKRRPMSQLKAHCRKLDALLERDLIKLDELAESVESSEEDPPSRADKPLAA